GVDAPCAGRTAIGLNGPTPGLCFQRAVHAMQFHPAGTRIYPHRAWRGLLQSDAPAATVAFKCAGDVAGVNRSAPGLGVHIALHPVDIDITRACFRMHPVTDSGNSEASRARADVERTSNPF